jgi:UDP-N-acetylmuramyl pentapeptide phosphotransferase/UDP-N-acetylglucosamine-1-phosphate transferase
LELTLNIVWAGIAATLLLFWATRSSWRSLGRSSEPMARADARRTAIGLLALLCVICILFPIISMTDDLNTSPAEPETVKSRLALFPHFLMSSGSWMLVYDPNASAFRHQIEVQDDFGPPSHAFLSFFLTRRPPPLQFA